MTIPDGYAPTLGAAMVRVISEWERDIEEVKGHNAALARAFRRQIAVCKAILQIADEAA